MEWLLLCIIICVLCWLLYESGYGVVSSKRAIIFVCTKRGKKASFTSCTGCIKRIIRFREDALINVSFTCELTKGDVTVELFDRTKQQLLRLDSTTPYGSVTVKRNQRCILVVRFRGATGEYLLDWQ